MTARPSAAMLKANALPHQEAFLVGAGMGHQVLGEAAGLPLTKDIDTLVQPPRGDGMLTGGMTSSLNRLSKASASSNSPTPSSGRPAA